jgi:hypothetical protein
MLNKRRKREKLPDYAVRFIGYSARIIARKGNAEYAFFAHFSGQWRPRGGRWSSPAADDVVCPA